MQDFTKHDEYLKKMDKYCTIQMCKAPETYQKRLTAVITGKSIFQNNKM
jgi:hypothetical protein